MTFGKLASRSRQCVVDSNDAKLSVKIVDGADGIAQCPNVDSADSLGHRNCRASLGINELAGGR